MYTTCPNCHRRLAVSDACAGQSGTCNHCGAWFTVPAGRQSHPYRYGLLVVVCALLLMCGIVAGARAIRPAPANPSAAPDFLSVAATPVIAVASVPAPTAPAPVPATPVAAQLAFDPDAFIARHGLGPVPAETSGPAVAPKVPAVAPTTERPLAENAPVEVSGPPKGGHWVPIDYVPDFGPDAATATETMPAEPSKPTATRDKNGTWVLKMKGNAVPNPAVEDNLRVRRAQAKIERQVAQEAAERQWIADRESTERQRIMAGLERDQRLREHELVQRQESIEVQRQVAARPIINNNTAVAVSR